MPQIFLRILLACAMMWVPFAQADTVLNSQTPGRQSAPIPVFLSDIYGNPTGSISISSGTPGAPTSSVLTVQGITSMTPLLVTDNTVAAAIAAAALTPPVQVRAQSIAVTDHASSTVTASGNDSMIALDSGTNYGAVISVTAASGTNPTFDLFLQECLDASNCVTIYQVERIKTTGTFVVPTQLLTGNRKWTWSLAGTSPSFTFSITGTRGSAPAPLIRQFFDYTTINPNTLGSNSPTWNVAGCKTTEIFAFDNTTTTAAVFQIAQSPDGSNFGTIGSTINPGSNTLAMQNVQHPMRFARITVATAGSGQTNNYVGLYCTN